MSKKDTLKPIAAAIGAALVGTLSAGVAGAAENPFGLQQLDSGYMQVAAAEGKCGGEKSAEGKCGGEKSAEGKCGAGMASEGEGAAEPAAEGEKATEGKCGGDKKPMEGKCGEGKCGGNK